MTEQPIGLGRLIVRSHRWSWRWWYAHIVINRLAQHFAPYGYWGLHDPRNHWLWKLNTWAYEQDMWRMPSNRPRTDRHDWHRATP